MIQSLIYIGGFIIIHKQTVLINPSISNIKTAHFKLCFRLPIHFDFHLETRSCCLKFFYINTRLVIPTLGAEYSNIQDETALNTLKIRTCYYPKFQKINVATWIQRNSTHFLDTTKTKDIHIKVILFYKQNMIFDMLADILNSENQQ